MEVARRQRIVFDPCKARFQNRCEGECCEGVVLEEKKRQQEEADNEKAKETTRHKTQSGLGGQAILSDQIEMSIEAQRFGNRKSLIQEVYNEAMSPVTNKRDEQDGQGQRWRGTVYTLTSDTIPIHRFSCLAAEEVDLDSGSDMCNREGDARVNRCFARYVGEGEVF